MLRSVFSFADFLINATLFVLLLVAIPHLRAHTPLEAEYWMAATDWAAAIGHSDKCLRKDSIALLQPEATLGAAAIRPTGWDYVTGARLRTEQELHDSMRIARFRTFMEDNACMFPGALQSNLRTVVMTARARLDERSHD